MPTTSPRAAAFDLSAMTIMCFEGQSIFQPRCSRKVILMMLIPEPVSIMTDASLLLIVQTVYAGVHSVSTVLTVSEVEAFELVMPCLTRPRAVGLTWRSCLTVIWASNSLMTFQGS